MILVRGSLLSAEKKIGEAKWLDGKRSFVKQAQLYNIEDTTKVDFLVTDQWSLSDDGKELTLITLLAFGGQILNTKAVYDKRETRDEKRQSGNEKK